MATFSNWMQNVGRTIQNAIPPETIRAFVEQNLQNPQAIYQAMMDYGVTLDELVQATGYTPQQIGDYFTQAGIVNAAVGNVPASQGTLPDSTGGSLSGFMRGVGGVIANATQTAPAASNDVADDIFGSTIDESPFATDTVDIPAPMPTSQPPAQTAQVTPQAAPTVPAGPRAGANITPEYLQQLYEYAQMMENGSPAQAPYSGPSWMTSQPTPNNTPQTTPQPPSQAAPASTPTMPQPAAPAQPAPAATPQGMFATKKPLPTVADSSAWRAEYRAPTLQQSQLGLFR